MANLGARQRVYEILTKLSRGEDLGLSSKNFSTNNEMVELVELLTNNSPFIDIESVKVQYSQLLDGNPGTLGQHYSNDNIIEYSIPFLESVAKNQCNIMILFDTVFHEQTHHYQDWHRRHSYLIDNLDFKRIVDAMLDGKPTEDEIKELHEFANKHKLLGKKLTQKKIETLQFGAYLSNYCEIDARKSAYKTTSKAYEIMINDPQCPTELKNYLTAHYESYLKDKEKEQARDEKIMQDYKNLNKRVEQILLKSIRSGEKLSSKNKTILLNGMLNHITKSLSLSENLEIAKWALENNYTDLIKQINLRNSISSQKRDLSHFITDLLSDNVLTAENFSEVCSLFSSFEHSNNNEAIDYLVANLADRAEVKIMLDNCDIGKNQNSINNYISSQSMGIALKNYLNRIENSKNIENYEEYQEIENEIRTRLTARGLGVNVEETQKLFAPFIARFEKINNNKEIKINGQVQQKSETTIEPIHNTKLTIEEMLKDKDIIKEINFDGKSNDINLSGKLIGEVYRYSIIHQSESVGKEEIIKYIKDIKNIQLQSYTLPEENRASFVESERSRIIAKSIADKLNIDHSSGMPSPENLKRIKEYFIKNYVENGYVFHSFPKGRKESVEKDGFTRVEKLWDNAKVSEVVKIFEDKGVIKALGGYGFYSPGGTYVEHNPEEIFFHELSSPEWFKIFTSSAHSLSDKSLESSPFFVKNYEACKQNVKDLCENAGLTREEKEKVSSLFKESWEKLGHPELTTALIPKKKIGKNNIPKEIEEMNIFDTISYVLSDSAGEFNEHTGNVVDLSKIEGKDIEVVEMPPADTFLTCDNFKRETKEDLYDPEKNIHAIYYGIVSSDGTKTLTQDQYNKVFNKIEETFADKPDKLEDIKENWIKFDKSIQHSSLDSKKQDEIVSNFRGMETQRQELNAQQSMQPTTPPQE